MPSGLFFVRDLGNPSATHVALEEAVLGPADQVIQEAGDRDVARLGLMPAERPLAGGRGCQKAVGWNDSQLIYGPSGKCDGESDCTDGYRVVHRADSAINVGLRIMGVRAADGLDEYGSAGLDRHRFTADWLGK
jgi:hypothetical protein